MNFKLLIQYDGTDFHGWQVQEGQRTVQGELERVLSLLEDAKVHVAGSGRTDAGVHAEGQVASANLTREIDCGKLRAAINGNLPRDVRVMQVEEAADDFHARFSVKSKTYVYRVVNAPVISPFLARYAHHEGRALDLKRMEEAAKIFVGKHDWTAFSNINSDAEDRVRTITEFSVNSRNAEKTFGALIEFQITGEGFLRYMVRSIAGTILEVGRGEKDFDTIRTAIESGRREFAGTTAPANGLTLLKVSY
jgi:tRNA pseudouridine38-40 synthase